MLLTDFRDQKSNSHWKIGHIRLTQNASHLRVNTLVVELQMMALQIVVDLQMMALQIVVELQMMALQIMVELQMMA